MSEPQIQETERWTICLACGDVLLDEDEGACECDLRGFPPTRVEVVPVTREAALLGKLEQARQFIHMISLSTPRPWSEGEVAATIQIAKFALADLRPEEER